MRNTVALFHSDHRLFRVSLSCFSCSVDGILGRGWKRFVQVNNWETMTGKWPNWSLIIIVRIIQMIPTSSFIYPFWLMFSFWKTISSQEQINQVGYTEISSRIGFLVARNNDRSYRWNRTTESTISLRLIYLSMKRMKTRRTSTASKRNIWKCTYHAKMTSFFIVTIDSLYVQSM